MLRLIALALLIATPTTAQAPLLPADPATAAFVRDNLVATFYHEVGHALIDTLELPVLGREEDAADTLSVLLIDRLWQEDAAEDLIRSVADAYLLFDAQSTANDEPLPYWDTHSLDLQRYYNTVCLFYGADPDAREDLADALDLPAERRESCQEEYQLAADSWGAMLDGRPPQDHNPAFRLIEPAGQNDLTELIATEVGILNGEYGLPVRIDVTVETCGEANAFYDLRARRVVMCVEYADDLTSLYSDAPR